ncbi:MAG TPA: YtxH domain-containing protein [Saprospiraceae bacterium]|nr:YtxH domain-containing protein [Saprospiraceae bacterium]HNG90401.1 YtxH domain-containing protein [Saprospiraceae bacterium]
MTTQGKILLGVAGAALTGVAIGLLVAPCSGEETRTNIRKNVNSMANDMLDTLRNGGSISEQVSSLVDSAKAKYNEAKGYVNSKSSTFAEQVEDAAETVKAKYNEAKGYVNSKTNTFADQVEDAADTVKAKYNEAKGYVKAEANTLKSQVEAAV